MDGDGGDDLLVLRVHSDGGRLLLPDSVFVFHGVFSPCVNQKTTIDGKNQLSY